MASQDHWTEMLQHSLKVLTAAFEKQQTAFVEHKSHHWLDHQFTLKKAGLWDLNSLPRYAQVTLEYASVILSLKQGVILTCIFQATNIDGNKKLQVAYMPQMAKGNRLSSQGFMQAFYLPDTLQCIWDDWPCTKSSVFFLCSLHSSSPALPGCWISHLPSSHGSLTLPPQPLLQSLWVPGAAPALPFSHLFPHSSLLSNLLPFLK